MPRTYVYPKFSTLGAFGFRTGGPGLGNLFFPYARALALAKKYGWTMINPSWPTVKLGPMLRGERDMRLYLKIFKIGGVSGPRKTFLLLMRPKVSEEEAAAGTEVPAGSILTTSGLRNYFRDIDSERDHIALAMRQILLERDKRAIKSRGPYGIGVHVRMGDFTSEMRVPLEWYVKMIEKIRRAAGWEAPVNLASDGSGEELAELLRVPGIKRINLNAVGDIFALSSCKIVLASNSTFSAWAAFLGHIPIIWARRGPELEGLFADDTFDEVLGADEELPPRLIGYLKSRLGGKTKQ